MNLSAQVVRTQRMISKQLEIYLIVIKRLRRELILLAREHAIIERRKRRSSNSNLKRVNA